MKLTTSINKQGEYLNREININIQKKKSDLDEMDSNPLKLHNSFLKSHIVLRKQLLEKNDISLVSA